MTRNFNAAETPDWLADWLSGASTLPRDQIKRSLQKLRSRSRDLYWNSTHAGGHMESMRLNVLGHKGIIPRVKAGRQVSERIKKRWNTWTRKGNCTPCEQMTFRDVQALALESLIRDGEIVVEMSMGRRGFRVQVLDSDQLDIDYEVDSDQGAKILMGVEQTQEGRPIAYHIRPVNLRGRRARLPANRIVHAYRRHFAGQVRGYPWLHAAMLDLKQHADYRESELVAARAGAKKLGFYTGVSSAFGPSLNGGEREPLPRDIPSGSFEELPEGVSVEAFDPQHPNAGFDKFDRSILRSVAASQGVSYTTFAADLDGVSYSSARVGMLAERDMYREVQGFLIDHLLQPVFDAWVDTEGLLGRLPASPENLRDVDWRTRGWAWVDPLKETQAVGTALELGLTTLTRELAKQGLDFDEMIEERAEELDKMKAAGITPDSSTPDGQNSPVDEDDPDGAGLS